MTTTTVDAERIVNCQKKTGAVVGILHNWLFDDSVLTLRNRVARGEIGDVLNIVVEALNRKEDSMAANKNHWSHKSRGGRFGEMLAHPVYLIRHFLGGDIEISSVQLSKLGDYEWMKSDELCAIFRVGAKMGRTYISFNSSRDAIYINLYGRKGIFKLDIINSSINFLPSMSNVRMSKGFDSLRQASQLVMATARNAGRILTKTWSTGHDNYIRLFAQSLLNCGVPPVSADDGLAVIKTVEAICDRIEEQEKSKKSFS
jgi:predicted dehydrogenase